MRHSGGSPAPDRGSITEPPGGRPARLHEIDLLRITAALAVVFYHYTFSGFGKGLTEVDFPSASEFTRYGYLGVDLFFVISGFVVLMSALNRKPEQFVISRIVRLYPAYWVAVTLTSIVSVLFSPDLFPVSPVQYLANMTMFNSPLGVASVDVVYWTLWAEPRFYLLTYPLYLVHVHIGFIVFGMLQDVVNPYVLLFGTVALMCLVATVLHRAVEKPLAPLLKRQLERPAKAVRNRLSRNGFDQPTVPIAAPSPIRDRGHADRTGT
ncbi:acyltransferase family protein [Saccharopolyspora sp. 5N708]|uniref:acyltransferase family protein n=1 Tax=Saccharopolyspora sp. 5N708 TaxID=3457424 RepID=UPI003FD0CBE9